MARDTISAALFSYLEKANGTGPGQFPFNTFVRRGFPPGKLNGAALPAGMLIKVGENGERRPGMGSGLARYTLDYIFLVYAMSANTPDSDIVDETTVINPILDALDLSLTSVPPGEKQTLGGLVEDAWFEGRTEIAQAILDQHIIMSIPIKVMCGRIQLIQVP